ncbi:hypothetical protein ACHAWF_004205 [Thalassiosira exigua]
MEAEYTGVEDVRGRTNIVRVRVAPNVTEIGRGAFRNCVKLKEVDLGNVTKIGGEAFCYCFSLASILLPPTVTEIGTWAFTNCPALVRIELCEGIQVIGDSAFAYCALKHINFPSSVTEIGQSAFVSCKALREVELSRGVQKIRTSAFQDCTSLEIITLLSNFTDTGRCAFRRCTSLRVVQLCEGIHHIASDSFRNCTSLCRISVPPNAFVIEWGDTPCCRLLSNSTIPSDGGDDERTVVSGKLGLQLLRAVEERINEIILQQNCTMGRKLELIRDMIAHFRMLDALTSLELAIGKSGVEAHNAEFIVINRLLPFLKSGNEWAFL